jgi:hypothetical protein
LAVSNTRNQLFRELRRGNLDDCYEISRSF